MLGLVGGRLGSIFSSISFFFFISSFWGMGKGNRLSMEGREENQKPTDWIK